MKQLIVTKIIEFPLKLTMAKTRNIFAAFAVAFLTSLPLSSAFVNQDFNIPKDFQKNFDLELQPFLREKREDVFLVKKHDPLEMEELSESHTVHDRRAIAEETKNLNHKDDGNHEEQRTRTEKNAEDDAFLYRNMQDLIQAFILADEQDIAMRLQQLREIENTTESKTLSNLPKRHASAVASAAAAAAGTLLGSNLWDAIPLTDLDAHSCEAESVEYGHLHLSGLVVHEFCCELRKLWHYSLIIARNLRSGLTLGPLIAEEAIAGSHGILGILFHHTPRLFHTIMREPHHLLVLPDIIRDAIPFPSVHGAIHRLLHVIHKIRHIVRELLWIPIHHVFRNFFHMHHLGVHLRERLLDHRLARLYHLYDQYHGFDSILPLGEEIVGGPVVSTATSAAASAAAAATSATATATAIDGGAIAPDYQTSLADLLSSFRGIYDGYYASGMPHMIRNGIRSISTSTVYTKVISYFSNMPSYLTNIGSYLSRIPSLYEGYTPLEQGSTVTATSTASASSSVGGPVVSPIMSVVEPIIGPTVASLAPIAPVVSSSASASAAVAETQPMISAVPNIISPVLPFSGAASAAATVATAAAAASAASASPIVSSYRTAPRLYGPALGALSIANNVVEESAVPCAPLIEPVSSGIVSETIKNTVSESSSSSVAVASPEVSIPVVENAAAAASASASASSTNIGPAISAGPLSLPYSFNGYRSRPLSIVNPAGAVSASSSASVSSGNNLIEPGQYRGLDWNFYDRTPLYSPRIFSEGLRSVAPSSVATAAAAASSGSGATAAASSASAASSGGLNFILPREHIVGALGHDYLTPGDLISITLRNKAILVGRILDATSPINFSFLRPKLRASLLRHGGRVWNLSPWDFKDAECIRRLNSPFLLRHAF